MSNNVINQPIKPIAKPVVKKSTFEKYQDPEGELTTGKFKFEFWYARNKILLYRLAVVGLIVFLVINFAYSILTFGNYLIFGVNNDNLLYQQLSVFPNYTGLQPHYSAQILQVLGVHIVPGGVKKTDLVAEVANPNEKFIANFTYYFITNGVATEKKSATILPTQTALVPLLGIEGADSPSSADLIIEDVRWSRISNHLISDVAVWQNERLNFLISDFQFIAAGNQEGFPNAHAIRFKIDNASPFGYKEAKFYVGLYQEQILTGVIPVVVANFVALEKRDIDLRGFAPNMFANQIKLYPDINLYNSEIYLPPPK
ncbi:MAG: hypothetical protein A2261_01455 [Candidatus Magasanikbacteria bacterium RIFOXYA2_FULL_44_8]|uniref:Uncharacterized protein n=1 Tax=Candidatus Magasanikbacteria bacterium RIFOXYA2_FULL_44_8 TaxID=1798696 RepID=A0A1F6NKT3_9BACT|nr:MAG: hypothetical protein A2261_01455 [Candidatus Magasanikbacteria bacterium RIFOXYA2_FULL_44_8]